MKNKIFALVCAAAMLISFVGCGAKPAPAPSSQAAPAVSSQPAPESKPVESKPEEEKPAPVDVKVMALKGPTAMGMVKMMDEVDNGNIKSNNYSFSLAGAIDEVTPKLVKGEVDIAAVPANLSSVLYNNTKGQVKVLAVNTLGVIYIVESGENVKTVEDLRGKTVYASGKGATPEYGLNYVLEKNGINPASDLTIEWKSEHAECLTALMADPNAIAMLPQPFVTTAQMKNEGIRVALDLTEEWEKLQTGEDKSMMITGVVVARADFIEKNPAAVADFLDNYSASVEFVNGNVEKAAELVGNYGIVPAPVAIKALPECNITFVEGAEMKEGLSGYLKALFDQNPKAVGGALPADDFYFAR
ncbi:MAG: ABC transporter substrate-binding protein [Oscillospiraceae bacterium]|nr:ABC transporter substrate-binding protein [Oscillospiraceae bacterium]MBQ4538126.1 ABC transporter substrate-binding protein [Oscillospiraceae bacterium]